ncbi:MAG: hypothetical protein ACK469_14585 [Bacteroidota bacterium]|jgi:hypothetical protein
MKKYILIIFLIIVSFQLMQAHNDPFIGYFENKTEKFFKGTKILGMISGMLIFQGQSVSYSLSKLEYIYYFTLDGVSLVVKKE